MLACLEKKKKTVSLTVSLVDHKFEECLGQVQLGF